MPSSPASSKQHALPGQTLGPNNNTLDRALSALPVSISLSPPPSPPSWFSSLWAFASSPFLTTSGCCKQGANHSREVVRFFRIAAAHTALGPVFYTFSAGILHAASTMPSTEKCATLCFQVVCWPASSCCHLILIIIAGHFQPS